MQPPSRPKLGVTVNLETLLEVTASTKVNLIHHLQNVTTITEQIGVFETLPRPHAACCSIEEDREETSWVATSMAGMYPAEGASYRMNLRTRLLGCRLRSSTTALPLCNHVGIPALRHAIVWQGKHDEKRSVDPKARPFQDHHAVRITSAITLESWP